jgi:hypothetical protein
VDQVEFGKDSTKLAKHCIASHGRQRPECVIDFSMPPNPGAAVRDPALEAVKLLVDNVNFPRLREMFADVASRSDSSLVSQIKGLKQMLDAGVIDEAQYRGAVDKLTGACQ